MSGDCDCAAVVELYGLLEIHLDGNNGHFNHAGFFQQISLLNNLNADVVLDKRNHRQKKEPLEHNHRPSIEIISRLREILVFKLFHKKADAYSFSSCKSM